MGEEEPSRDGSHPCCCVITIGEGSGENPCNNYVRSADAPFCSSCESRHPDMRGVMITARLRQR